MPPVSRRRFARVGDPYTHDALIREMNQRNDPQGLGLFADHLEEHGAPGARLARQAWKNANEPEPDHPFRSHDWWEGWNPNVGDRPWVGEEGQNEMRSPVPEGRMEVAANIGRFPGRAMLTVVHAPQNAPLPNAEDAGDSYLQYHVPVHSEAHLDHLISDLPPMQARAIKNYFRQNGHQWPAAEPEPPARMARRMAVLRFAAPKPFAVPAKKLVNKGPDSTRWQVPKGGTFSAARTPDLPKSLVGSKLAVVLHEIKDRLAEHDPVLKKLAHQALNGYLVHGGRDIFTHIRNRLLALGSEPQPPTEADAIRGKGLKPQFLSAPDPVPDATGARANELARAFNWHRIAPALELDHHVGRYIDSISSDRLKIAGAQYRAAHNLFGLGRKAPEDKRAAFHAGLAAHLKKAGFKRSEVAEAHVLKSLRRLGEGEETVERLTNASHKTPVRVNPALVPAWHGTPNKTGGARANPKAVAAQFRRRGLPHRYASDQWPYYGHNKFWMSPKGEITPVEDHEEWAKENGEKNGTVGLWDKGWVRMIHDRKGLLAHNESVSPTETQIRELRDHALIHGLDNVSFYGGKGVERNIRMSRRTDRPTRYATGPVAGLTYGSHPLGKYDLAHHAAANVERAALFHALHGLGMIPPRRPGQDPRAHFALANKIVDRYQALAQSHMNENPDDPLTRYYAAGADRYARPGAAAPTAGAIMRERGNPPEFNAIGLSAAVRPLLKKLAYDRDELPAEHIPPGLSRRGLPPADPADALAPHADYGPSDTGHGPEEFRLPSGFVDLAHPSPGAPIGEIKPSRRVISNPALPPTQRREVYASIAHHLANTRPGEPGVKEMLQEKHGFTPEQATRHYNNFLKLRSKPAGTRTIPPPMTPKGGRITRRKFAAYRAPVGGMVVRGNAYSGGSMVPNMQGEFMNPPNPRGGAVPATATLSTRPKTLMSPASRLQRIRSRWKAINSLVQ